MSKYKPAQVACSPPFVATLICFGLSTFFSPWLWLDLVLFAVGIIFLFDIGARYREYIMLVNKGAPWTGRDIRYFKLSFCRRWAAVQAGMDREIFHKMGYRWYHVLPDGFPMCFFKPAFWRSLFGIKRKGRLG